MAIRNHETVEALVVLRDEIGGLPERYRQALAYLWEGYSTAETAARMGVTPRTVRRWLRAVRERVQGAGAARTLAEP